MPHNRCELWSQLSSPCGSVEKDALPMAKNSLKQTARTCLDALLQFVGIMPNVLSFACSHSASGQQHVEHLPCSNAFLLRCRSSTWR